MSQDSNNPTIITTTLEGTSGADDLDSNVEKERNVSDSSDTGLSPGTKTTLYYYYQNIEGLEGDDTITGGDEDDTLDGGEDNDTIKGNDGRDVIYGGSGDDTIEGGEDPDYIEGGGDNDSIKGGAGWDTIKGGSGADTIWGGNNSDTIEGGSGNDSIEGGLGNDSIEGGSGNDTIDSGEDNDYIYAGPGNDSIDGGSGDDTIKAGGANDTIDGGEGSDIFWVESDTDFILTSDVVYGSDDDTFYNIETIQLKGGAESNNTFSNNGFSGVGTVVYDENVDDVDINEEDDGSWTVTNDSATDTITDFDQIAFEHSDNDKVTSIFSTEFNSTTIAAVAGADGDEYSISGNDVGSTTYLIGLEDTTDTVFTFDTEKLGDFINTITLPDQDIEDARLGSNIALDVLGAGLSALPVVGDVASTGVAIYQEWVNYGYDTAQIEAQYEATAAALEDAEYDPTTWISAISSTRDVIRIEDFQIGVDNIVLPTTEAEDSVYYQMTETTGGVTVSVKIGTSDAEDFLFIKNKYSTITDGEFADLLLDMVIPSDSSSSSDDVVDFNGGIISTFKQTVIAVNGSSDIESETGTMAGDRITAYDYTGNADIDSFPDQGTFEIAGNYGDDLINGGSLNDFLYGGFYSTNTETVFDYEDDGDDILKGNGGDDILDGGTGDDILDGGDDNDTAVYTNAGYKLTVNGEYRGTRIELNTGTGYEWYGEGADAIEYIDQLVSIENVIGSNYIDTILGDWQGNHLSGLEGNDYLESYEGNDTLEGGSGDDILIGGTDADTFIFNSLDGIDTIEDFNGNENDLIQIDTSVFGSGDINDISYNSSNGNLSFNNHQLAILDNPTSFDSTDSSLFSFV